MNDDTKKQIDVKEVKPDSDAQKNNTSLLLRLLGKIVENKIDKNLEVHLLLFALSRRKEALRKLQELIRSRYGIHVSVEQLRGVLQAPHIRAAILQGGIKSAVHSIIQRLPKNQERSWNVDSSLTSHAVFFGAGKFSASHGKTAQGSRLNVGNANAGKSSCVSSEFLMQTKPRANRLTMTNEPKRATAKPVRQPSRKGEKHTVLVR